METTHREPVQTTRPREVDLGGGMVMGGTTRLWTHEETAKYLHISPWTLTHLIAEQAGPTVFRVGRSRRYDPANVSSWLYRNTIEPAARPSPAGRHACPDPGTAGFHTGGPGAHEGVGTDPGVLT